MVKFPLSCQLLFLMNSTLLRATNIRFAQRHFIHSDFCHKVHQEYRLHDASLMIVRDKLLAFTSGAFLSTLKGNI